MIRYVSTIMGPIYISPLYSIMNKPSGKCEVYTHQLSTDRETNIVLWTYSYAVQGGEPHNFVICSQTLTEGTTIGVMGTIPQRKTKCGMVRLAAWHAHPWH